MQDDELERAIDEALGGRPRAAEIAAMVAALQARRATWEAERDAAAAPDDRKVWEERLATVDAQIRTLQEEQAITEFVENSVRFAANRPEPDA